MRPIRTILLMLMPLLLCACGVREGFEPYDSEPEFRQFLKDFDNEYLEEFITTRARLHLLESAGAPDKARELARATAAALAASDDGPWPEPLATWFARPDSGITMAKGNPRPFVRAAIDALAKSLEAPALDWDALLADARTAVAAVPKPSFFTFAKIEELPADLKWETNLDAPEVGSPDAKKGGTFRQFMTAFPPSLRVVGNDSNNAFRSEHYDNVEMALVEMHPDTGELIPGLADRWAVSPDERTVYYHIDPDATFSDGKPVTADDFIRTFYVQLNRYVSNPFGKQFYREQLCHFTKFNDNVIALTARRKTPLAPLLVAVIPSHSGFYAEIGPDFEKRYDWRCRPTTGAYVLRPEGIEKGRSLTMFRVENWWAKDKRYRRHRFNADRIDHRVVRDIPKAWEVFRQGDLDTFVLTIPEYWYERSEVPEVFNGYIERQTFYNVWPGSGSGFYLNTAKAPLTNRDVRIGMAYACDWERVILVLMRGDAVRCKALYEGFLLIKDAPVTPRPFDPAKAREHFAAAGYTIPDGDGILKNAQGQRLSVSITVPQNAIRIAMINLLAEQAKKAGIEIKADAMEGTSAFQKTGSKLHQASFNAWGFNPPINDYFQYLHGSTAYEKDGRVKTDTNNLFSYSNPKMDKLCEAHRNATTLDEMSRLTAEIEQMIYDEGLFIPAVRVNFLREACWRWVRWPDQYATAACYISFDSYVWWIDQQLKEETLDARAHGRKFPEVMAMHDTFRNGPPAAKGPEPAPPPPQALPPS